MGDAEITFGISEAKKPLWNGQLLGEEHPKQSLLHSPIDRKSSSIMETTWSPSLRQNKCLPTTNSSCMMLPSEMKLLQGNKSFSLTQTGSTNSIQPSSYQMGLRTTQTNLATKNQANLPRDQGNQKPVTNSMPEPARIPTLSANIDTSAKNVTNLVMETKPVQKGANEVYGLQPKYLCHNLWKERSSLLPTTAEWSETARPLPRPPLSELSNLTINKTIADNPSLFQVQTPIKVDVFESLLKDYPNPPFVKSVCAGLPEGFWPWADTSSGGFPLTHDESCPMSDDIKQASFIQDQCLKERHKGFFSKSFGTELLPGMYSMPIYAVPKPSVWKSGPVRFFGQISTDRNRNQLPIMARPQITGPDRK